MSTKLIVHRLPSNDDRWEAFVAKKLKQWDLEQCALTPINNRTIVEGKRTLDSQVCLHGQGQLAQDFLRRFRQAAASLEQLGVRFHLDGDDLMIYQIPPAIQADFDAKGAVVGATWSVWDAGDQPRC